MRFLFKNTKKILGFDDRWFVFHGIILVSFAINAILFGSEFKSEPSLLFGSCFFISLLYTSCFWVIFRSIHLQVVSKLPGFEFVRRRYVVLIPVVIVTFVIVKFGLDATIHPLTSKIFPNIGEPSPFVATVASFFFLILIISIYEGAYLFAELKKSRLEREVLVKENITSQLEGLRNQVNPHFLFNSLNTLASVIPNDPDKAVRFVTKLSKVYRYILDLKDQKLIPIKKELDFLQSYTFLLKERFGENISFDIDVEEDDYAKLVVPLSLQLTFENAIKHNIITKSKPLEIQVYLENDNLVVKNTLQIKNTVGSSTKMGLQNIKNRYSFFTDKEVGVVTTMSHFIVTLPLLSSSVSVNEL